MGKARSDVIEEMVNMANSKLSQSVIDSLMHHIDSNGGAPIFPVKMEVLYYWAGIWLREFAVKLERGEINVNEIIQLMNERKIELPKSGKNTRER